MYAEISVYQLKQGKNNGGVMFRSLAYFTARKGVPAVTDYDCVYKTTTAALGLVNVTESHLKEELFRVFNISKPHDFKGHSLSVSDVITIDEAAYYVDVFGFKKLDNFKFSLIRKEKRAENN